MERNSVNGISAGQDGLPGIQPGILGKKGRVEVEGPSLYTAPQTSREQVGTTIGKEDIEIRMTQQELHPGQESGFPLSLRDGQDG
jgi:hypothetical protein